MASGQGALTASRRRTRGDQPINVVALGVRPQGAVDSAGVCPQQGHEGQDRPEALAAPAGGEVVSALVTVAGWALDTSTDEPRIRDLDLAEKLGFKEPRAIRKLIKRYVKSGDLSRDSMRDTVSRIEIRPGVFRDDTISEAWLTEAEALFVIAKSTTPMANAITREVIDVFLAYRRGKLAPVAQSADLAAVREAMGELRRVCEEIRALSEAVRSPAPPEATIGVAGARRVSAVLNEAAAHHAVATPALSRRSHRGSVEADLCQRLEWAFAPWHLFPASRSAQLERALHAVLQRARKAGAATVDARQLKLPEGNA